MLFIIAVISVYFLFAYSNTITYTSDGNWKPATGPECDDRHFLCTKSGLTWTPNNEKFKIYNNVSACDALLAKGINKILFHGDSYMRQIYAALLITLNGNYRDGSLRDPQNTPHCRYHSQFFEKKCNTLELNHWGNVCDGKLLLDPLLTGFDELNTCGHRGTVVLWSFGNHQTAKGNGGRWGVNNATIFQSLFERSICPSLERMKSESIAAFKSNGRPMQTGDVSKACSVWWVSTHYRLVGHFADETPEYIRNFNLGMRNFFDSGRCGLVNYIDVYNMTAELTTKHAEDAQSLTYDSVHWGFEVNLMKAQIILNALLSPSGDPNQIAGIL